MEGLGGVVELLLLRSWPSHTLRGNGRDTFVFDCQLTCGFISRSVPEAIRDWHPRSEPQLTLRAASGEQPAEGRAATTRLTPSLMNLPAAA
jgi:hypothetical protein